MENIRKITSLKGLWVEILAPIKLAMLAGMMEAFGFIKQIINLGSKVYSSHYRVEFKDKAAIDLLMKKVKEIQGVESVKEVWGRRTYICLPRGTNIKDVTKRLQKCGELAYIVETSSTKEKTPLAVACYFNKVSADRAIRHEKDYPLRSKLTAPQEIRGRT